MNVDEPYLDNDEGPLVIAVEAGDPPAALWVRVGPVFNGNDKMLSEPGVWINFQPQYMNSPLTGPILLTKELWDELDTAVRDRLADFDPTLY